MRQTTIQIKYCKDCDNTIPASQDDLCIFCIKNLMRENGITPPRKLSPKQIKYWSNHEENKRKSTEYHKKHYGIYLNPPPSLSTGQGC